MDGDAEKCAQRPEGGDASLEYGDRNGVETKVTPVPAGLGSSVLREVNVMVRPTRLALALLLVAVEGVTTASSSSARAHPVATQGARTAASSAATAMNAYLSRLSKSGTFDGTVLVARHGKVLFDRGYGFANRSRNLRNTAHTPFRVFYLSEPFAAAAVLMLRDQNKLRLSDSVCKYLSSCPPAWQPINIDDLLSHRSGIPHFGAQPGVDISKPMTPQQVIAAVRDTPLSFVPGTNFARSATDDILLGLIVEHVSGQSYGTWLQQHVFQPLGMHHSSLLQDGMTVPGLATLYRGTTVDNGIDATTAWAAAGLYSTVKDQYIWDRAIHGGTILSSASRRAMFTSHTSSASQAYGYGWLFSSLVNRPVTYTLDFSTLNLRFPRQGVTIIVLSNQERSNPVAIVTRISRIVFASP